MADKAEERLKGLKPLFLAWYILVIIMGLIKSC